MPEHSTQLKSALGQALLDLTGNQEHLAAFCDTLLQHGGILRNCKKYCVPAAAVPVAINKPLSHMLEALPSYEHLPRLTKSLAKRSRSRALTADVGLIAAVTQSLLTSNSHAAAIRPGHMALSRTVPPAFNSHTTYLSLLQQAAAVTGAPLPSYVSASPSAYLPSLAT